jgi:hypothetical protein
MMVVDDDINNWSDDSSDESWTPSIDGEEELSDDEGIDWRETPFQAGDVYVTFDKTDSAMIENYIEEKKQIQRRLMDEVQRIHTQNEAYVNANATRYDCKSPLTTNEIMNCILSPVIVYEFMGIMNAHLVQNQHVPVDFKEFQALVRIIFWFCFYNKGPCDVCMFPENYGGGVVDELKNLKGVTISQHQHRLKQLLRSFDGQYHGSHDISKTWQPVYDNDIRLERLFRMIGERTSQICYIPGRTSFVIDDDKLRMRSFLAALLNLVRSKGLNSFGPVCNSVNSLIMGIQLSGYMSHHGENATNILRANLLTIAGQLNPSSMNFPDTDLLGDRGYYDEKYFKTVVDLGLHTTNTVKRSPALAFKFGKTAYMPSREQRSIAEAGPAFSLGATRSIGEKTLHFVMYRNGTGRITFLQSTRPHLAANHWEYVSESRELLYSKKFHEIVQRRHAGFMREEVRFPLPFREQIFQAHGLCEETKSQGTPEWFILRLFRLTSTLSHRVLPRCRDSLSQTAVWLLENDLGLHLESTMESAPVDPSHASKSMEQLMRMSRTELSNIAKSYGRPHSGSKEKLAFQIQEGVKEQIELTTYEKLLKSTFVVPLSDKEKTPHKIGSLNEAKVRAALQEIMKGYDVTLRDCWECGLLSQDSQKFLATSLDGWLVYSENDDSPCEEWKHAGLEIKTPTGSAKRELVMRLRDEFGEYTESTLGDDLFKALVYEPNYRVQVLHHAAVCNFEKVLFIVANEYKPIFSTLISFTTSQKQIYKSLLMEIYYRDLSWAYTTAWNDAKNPENHVPQFRQRAVSTSSFGTDQEVLLFQYALWRILLKLVREAGMPLPRAKRIVPSIVAFWNKGKGRIDEMSRYLLNMKWPFTKATPKQFLTIRELHKVALNVFLLKKHCYTSISQELLSQKSFSQLRLALAKSEGSLSTFLLEIAKTYTILGAMYGMIPSLPQKRPRERGLDGEESEEDDDTDLKRRLDFTTLWQKEARDYCASITRDKLQHFQTDPMLNRIRLDCTLNHEPIARHGPSNKEKRNRCTLCSSGRTGIHTTSYYCPTCCVYLCIVVHEGHKDTCRHRFHYIKDPKNLVY